MNKKTDENSCAYWRRSPRSVKFNSDLEHFIFFLNLKCFSDLYPWAIYDLQYALSATSFNIIYISQLHDISFTSSKISGFRLTISCLRWTTYPSENLEKSANTKIAFRIENDNPDLSNSILTWNILFFQL